MPLSRQRVILSVVAVVVAVIALVWIIGMLVPVQHTAAVRVHVRQPPERVYETISDVRNAVRWRSDLQQVEVLSPDDAPLRWRETTDYGQLIMKLDEAQPPARMVVRIDDPDQPFGGRWIYDLAPTATGTTLTITEEGEVYNAFFRFMSRFIFGHYDTLESVAADLARHFGETAEPERVGER